MAKRKKGKRSTAHLRRWQFKSKKKRKGKKTMAKKRRKSTKRRSTRRSSRRGARRVGRRGGGARVGLIPAREDLHMMAASASWGYLEGKAKTDDSFILNKVPKPVSALGFTGNIALLTHLLALLTKNRWLKLGARATANIACYQLGRKGSAFASGKEFFVGYSDDDVAAAIEQASAMGALAADGGGMPGIESELEYGMEYGG